MAMVVFHGWCGPFVFSVMVEGEGKGGRLGMRFDMSRVPRLLVWREGEKEGRRREGGKEEGRREGGKEGRREGGKEGGSGRVLTRPESLVFLSAGRKEGEKEGVSGR